MAFVRAFARLEEYAVAVLSDKVARRLLESGSDAAPFLTLSLKQCAVKSAIARASPRVRSIYLVPSSPNFPRRSQAISRGRRREVVA